MCHIYAMSKLLSCTQCSIWKLCEYVYYLFFMVQIFCSLKLETNSKQKSYKIIELQAEFKYKLNQQLKNILFINLEL